MKQLIQILISVILSCNLYGQRIENGYYSNTKKNMGFDHIFFNFYGVNEFKYLSAGCLGSTFGIGKYEIANDSIYLKFSECNNCERGIDLKRVTSNSDSLRINLKIKDYSGELPGATCTIEETSQTFQADFNGNISVKIAKSNNIQNLRIGFAGYISKNVVLEPNLAELTGTIIIDGNSVFKKNDTIVLSIKKISKSKITIKAYKDITFEKLPKNTFLKRLSERFRENEIESYTSLFK